MLSLLFGPARRAASPDAHNDFWFTSVGRRTNAGVVVTEDLALTYSAVWCATRVICETSAGLPLLTYRKGADDSRSQASDHYLYELLKTAPNPGMGSMAFREGRTMHQVLWGQGFAEIEWDATNPARRHAVLALHPIHPCRVWPAHAEDAAEGYAYRVRNNDGSEVLLRADEMLHVPGVLSEDGVWGKGVVAYARESIGFGIGVERFGANFFGSGGQPRGIVYGPGMKDPEARRQFRTEWAELHGSPDSTEIAILPTEAKYERLTLSNEDNQFLACVVPETLITLADGTRKRADEISVSDFVFGWNGEKLVPSRIEAAFDNGVHPLVRITTSRGRQLTSTLNHPYLAGEPNRCKKCNRFHGPAKGGLAPRWVKAEDLKVGDHVRAGLTYRPAEAAFIPEEEAWFIGAMVGDGYCRKSGATFSNANASVVASARSYVESIGATMKKVPTSKYDYAFAGCGKMDSGTRRGIRSHVSRLLRKYQLAGKDSYTKRVPDLVMKSNATAKAAFLSGLFDTDGSIRHLGYAQPLAYVCSVSRGLLDDCQELLASLGIQSKVSLAKRATTRDRYISGRLTRATADTYNLHVCGKAEIAKLAAILRLQHDEKSKRLKSWAKRISGERKEHSDFFAYDRIAKIEMLPAGRTIGLTVEGTFSHVTNGIVTHNTRKYNVNEIARWFRLPAHMLGDLERATHSNIEVQSIEFVVYSLLPWLRRWEEQIALKLLLPRDRGTIFAEHQLAGLLRGDIQARMNAYRVAIGIGVMTINEARRLENLNGIGPAGDANYVPVNMTTADAMLQSPPLPGSSSSGPGSDQDGAPADARSAMERLTRRMMKRADRQALAQHLRQVERDKAKQVAQALPDLTAQRHAARAVLEDTLRRLFSKEAKAAERAARGDFDAWLGSFYASHRGLLTEALRPVVQLLSSLGLGLDLIVLAEWIIVRSHSALQAAYNSDTREQFAARLAAWPAKRVREAAEHVFVEGDRHDLLRAA